MIRVLAILLALAVAPAAAQEVRPLATDRPDRTESPYAVPQGYWQVEVDLATLTRDRVDGVRTDTLSLAPLNLKRGIAHDTDVQLIVAPYVRQREGGRTIDGIGDVTVRLKQNLIGDDGGDWALAVMPFVTLPTARAALGAEGVEGGVIVPVSVDLAEGVSLGAMTEVDAVREDGRYRAIFVNSATLGVKLAETVGSYAEVYTERGRDWIVTGDVGLTWQTSEVTQLDAGVNLGLSDAAEDVTLFVGFSRRF